MKLAFKVLCIFFMMSYSAYSADCGKVKYVNYSPDHGGLVGFSVDLNNGLIRITQTNSPLFVSLLSEEVKFDQSHWFFFVCLDDYEIYLRTYRRKIRRYGKVINFRIYKEGELRVKNGND